jgi:hypothetical protein
MTTRESQREATRRYLQTERGKQKNREHGRVWRERHAAEHRRYNQDRVYRALIKKAYGLTAEQYNEMIERQGGMCAICACHPDHPRNAGRSMLAVDHDHMTGRVRALLCQSCNQMIGMANELPHILEWAVEYLQRVAWEAEN